MGESQPFSLFIFVFLFKSKRIKLKTSVTFKVDAELTVHQCDQKKLPNVILKFVDDWIRTADLLCRKRPLSQLSHNHEAVDVCCVI